MKDTNNRKSPLTNAEELALLIMQENTVLIDARTGPSVKEKYRAEHLEGARFVDLDKDLSEKADNPANGGRHPLPSIKKFTELLGRLGINKLSNVVVYDDKAGANAAARFWWLLRSVGHDNIRVLDGGFNAAIEAGLPVSNLLPDIKFQPAYPADKWILPTVDADTVAKATSDPGFLVIDVREAYRYKGESEPIDLIAGHIPGAINIPYTTNLDEKANFLSPGELADKYKEAISEYDPGKVIVHCGSGVTACHTLLAIEQAGIEMPNLYVGSWSEWSRNDRPVSVGE